MKYHKERRFLEAYFESIVEHAKVEGQPFAPPREIPKHKSASKKHWRKKRQTLRTPEPFRKDLLDEN